MEILKYVWCLCIFFYCELEAGSKAAQDRPDIKIVVSEVDGLERQNEYIELALQIYGVPPVQGYTAIDTATGETVFCQVFDIKKYEGNRFVFKIILPLSIDAFDRRVLMLRKNVSNQKIPETDLRWEGENTELLIENKFFQANLTRTASADGKNHASGQLRELFVKLGVNQLLQRSMNRMHWAPNFKRPQAEDYITIAHWEAPEILEIETGPYLIKTIRQDKVPDFPEILLSAVYTFYADKPFFKFYSRVDIRENIWLDLLRNDEMTMDSLFTHLAFERPDGQIVNLPFTERYTVLEQRPLENEAPWLCFYHLEKGYAFGSIRILYDIRNNMGQVSPTFFPHTKISDGAGGGKYWNRRLIDDQPTLVPRGSKYAEENVYLISKSRGNQPWTDFVYWRERLLKPLQSSVLITEN